ncbi:MAG TPA: hypothetical protein IAC91_07410 [Candidatus Faecimorpha stercoravium]|nr:hypothetical protein [Candidatus Faecimorpha stercoravium]
MRKNLSLILSILLVLTLCLGGCNPSDPDESSAQEESSVLEEASQVEESSVPEESSQPEESSVPEEPSQPEESFVPEEPSQPEESSVPEEPSQPEESFVPEEPSQPEESSMPEDPSLLVERPASPSAGDTEEMLAAFRDIVASLEEEHGKTTGKADGLCFVKLIDLDRDGVDELFCAWEVDQYCSYMTEIYQWIDHEAVLLHQETSYNIGTSIQPCVCFYIGEDTVYIPYGSENYYEYKSLINHKIETAFTTYYSQGYPLSPDAGPHEINGNPYLTYDEYAQAIDDLIGDMERVCYEFIDIDNDLFPDEHPPVIIEVF